jgi:DNA-binding transcriptional ArsR family regulator
MKKILQFLRKYGDSRDSEIAEALGASIAQVRVHLNQLSEKGHVVSYHSIKYEDGIKIEGMRYRITGILLEARPGRKKVNQVRDFWILHNSKT